MKYLVLSVARKFPEHYSKTPLISLRSFNQKGQAEKAGAKELNVSEPEEPYKEELEVTEKEDLTLDVSGEPNEGIPK